MRTIKNLSSIAAVSSQSSLFFIEAWYSLIHHQSLDSHRVRCMNSVNILRELEDLLVKYQLPGFEAVKKDISKVADESLAILNGDPILVKHFQFELENLLPLIETFREEKKVNQSNVTLLSYYLKDFIVLLHKDYKNILFSELEDSIGKQQPFEIIYTLTSLFLSTLLDEGYSIEGLFSIVRDIFIYNKSTPKYSFEQNLAFSKKLLVRPLFKRTIIFKLADFSKRDLVPEEIAGVGFFDSIPGIVGDSNVTRFLTPSANNLFVRVEVEAIDDRNAGIKGKSKIDNVLDLIRYELERGVVSVSHEFVSVNEDAQQARIFELPRNIPNPRKNINAEKFNLFLSDTSKVILSDNIDKEAKDKLLSAFRFYRLGSDNQNLENKLLNWWTALEYLCRTGERASIISSIENELTNTLLLDYLNKHISSYKDVLSFLGIEPLKKISEKYGFDKFINASNYDFFSLIHNEKEYSSITVQLVGHPFIQFKLDSFKRNTADTDKIKDILLKHNSNLIWHINRIWRVRCDIVHSAEHTLNLTLLCGNLEFYLKSLITMIIRTLNVNQNIHSLDELFKRYEHEKTTIIDGLDGGKVDKLKQLLN